MPLAHEVGQIAYGFPSPIGSKHLAAGVAAVNGIQAVYFFPKAGHVFSLFHPIVLEDG